MDTTTAALNRAQRWLLKRFAGRYARLAPELRPVATERDLFLFSTRAIGLWLGTACCIGGSTLALSISSPWASPWLFLLLVVLAYAGLFGAGMNVWLHPERATGKRLWRIGWIAMLATYAGTIASFRGDLSPLLAAGTPWYEAALRVFWRATPGQIVLLVVALLALSIVSAARRAHMRRALAQARAAQELDAAGRQLAQSRLNLLQAQIQPHFLFNTLAALQHWVDVGDARAAPLLRDLTSFLRGSTEAMLRPEVTLAEECARVERYLSIMQARLGKRLRWAIDVAPDCAAQTLPPGLVITLVENAVAHGIEPQLRGGEVHVIARRTQDGAVDLQVLDDGAGLPPDGARDGVGLANCRERLQHQFGPRAELTLGCRADERGSCARVHLPSAA